MKFLKAVRVDSSDTLVYSQEGAAQDGEWLVSGGYAVCDPTGATHRRPNCHCLTSFIGVVSHGRCTIAEIVEIGEVEYHDVIECLVRHFMDDLGAPTLEAACAVAEEEPPTPPTCAKALAPKCGLRSSALRELREPRNTIRCSSG